LSLLDYRPPRSVMDPKGKPKERIEIRVSVLEAGCFAKPLIAMPDTDRRSYPGTVATGSRRGNVYEIFSFEDFPVRELAIHRYESSHTIDSPGPRST
jgi:hypothetical protein